MIPQKNVVIYTPNRFADEVWIPVLWAQAKTYFEKHSNYVNHWNWVPCYADAHGSNVTQIQNFLRENPPDIFAVSLYVWNYELGHTVAQWVKQTWPNCIVITGGPHQYFKHRSNWFKEHPYIDASLPSSSYGELCFQEVLDSVASGNINWDSVTDIAYPYGHSRSVCYSKKQSHNGDKKYFDYKWSALSSQYHELAKFVDYVKSQSAKNKVLTILETTRGCPYGCTYCDWGGGINSYVLQKPIEFIRSDINAICQLDVVHVYFADANFGIFGSRDVDTIKYLAQTRLANNLNFSVGYGGFAKTNNRLQYVKEILQTDLKYGLSMLGEIKLSIQTLDDDVLRRIDRKNVKLSDQLAMVQDLTKRKKLPVYIELINGLPGMTLDKFYYELNVLGSLSLAIQWYPWILLPEAPAYNQMYREAQGIGSVSKNTGWWTSDDNSHNEIVVSTISYSTDDYLEMMLAGSLYRLFVQGGFYSNSVAWLKQHNIQLGDLIRRIYNEFLADSKFIADAQYTWNNNILQDPMYGCFIDVGELKNVYLGLYFIAVALMYHQDFSVPLGQWLQQQYQIPTNKISADLESHINSGNLGSKKRVGLTIFDYSKDLYNLKTDATKILLCFIQFKHTGNAILANKKLLGII